MLKTRTAGAEGEIRIQANGSHAYVRWEIMSVSAVDADSTVIVLHRYVNALKNW